MRTELAPYVGQVVVIHGWISSVKKALNRSCISNVSLYPWDERSSVTSVTCLNNTLSLNLDDRMAYSDHFWLWHHPTMAPNAFDQNDNLYKQALAFGRLATYSRANGTLDIGVHCMPIVAFSRECYRFRIWREDLIKREGMLKALQYTERFWRSLAERTQRQGKCGGNWDFVENTTEKWLDGYMVDVKLSLDQIHDVCVAQQHSAKRDYDLNKLRLMDPRTRSPKNPSRVANIADQAKNKSYRLTKAKPFGTTYGKTGRRHNSELEKDRRSA